MINVKEKKLPFENLTPVRVSSPLRYPGGKGGLAKFLASVVKENDLVGCQYFEPFAGGGGAAFRLLDNNLVSDICLNDADPCIYAFWKSALRETDRFVGNVLETPLSIEEWRRQQAICLNPKRQSTFDLGFATFYLNRCNRSGILIGAGPIGGYSQSGEWRLDARFNRENLASRIFQLGTYRKNIRIYKLDALKFLSSKLPMGKKRREVFVYLDPPYLKAGRRLYYNFYKEKDHRALARYIVRQKTLTWIMSYDKSDFIGKLYKSCQRFQFPLNYSLQRKQIAQEMLVVPNITKIPKRTELLKANVDLKRLKMG